MPAEVAPFRDEVPLFEDYLNSAFPCDDLFFNHKDDSIGESPLLRTYSEERGAPSSPESSHSSNSKDDSANEADSDVSLAIRLSNDSSPAPAVRSVIQSGRNTSEATPSQAVGEEGRGTPRPVPTSSPVKPMLSVSPSYQLNLHGIPSKSRVETQIRLGLQVVRVQHDGVDSCETEIGDRFQWLKLPSWAMAKEKLKLQNRRDAPPTIDPNRIIFLDARVVKSTDPLEDVTICAGCVTRERKRAQRKKDLPKRNNNPLCADEASSKAETSELVPLPDENKKILVFNCPELLEITNGEVTIPTRVTCYCRHHKEKDGFRIIITLRDALNNILASTSSELVLITDDHKTTGKVQRMKEQVTSSVKGQPYVVPTQELACMDPQQGTQHIQTGQALRSPHPLSTTVSRRSSVSSTATASRKRKAEIYVASNQKASSMSKIPKIPGTLSMTNMNNHIGHLNGTGPYLASGATSQVASPAPSTQQFKRSPSQDSLAHFMRQSPSVQYRSTENSMPTTSAANSTASPENCFFDTSMEELMHDRSVTMSPRSRTWDYIMETSTPPRNGVAQGTASLIMPPTSSHQPIPDTPVISRMIPAEGPLQGGIEVTILGNGFYPGMTAIFGDVAAIPTHCWSSTTLVCVLPPATNAGPVPVTFKEHPHSNGSKLFTYIDETDRALYELALQVIGLKTTGKLETARDVAMRICSSKLPSESVDVNFGAMPVKQLQAALGVTGESPGIEELIRGCLRFLDEIDDSRPVRISLRSKSGHTMLHLATIQGYSRLVQDLLERGASANIRDRTSFTALHNAALYGNLTICRLMVSCNSTKLSLCTNDGRTAYDLATLHGEDDELLELLDPWIVNNPTRLASFRSSRSNSVASSIDDQASLYAVSRRASISSEMYTDSPVDSFRGTRQHSIASRHSGTRTQPSSRSHSPESPAMRRRNSELSLLHRTGSLNSLSLQYHESSDKHTSAKLKSDTTKPATNDVQAVQDVQRVVNNLMHLQQTWMDFLSETSPMWLQKTLANANASLPDVLKTTPNITHHMPFGASPISAFQAMLPQLPNLRQQTRADPSTGVSKGTNMADAGWLQSLVSSLGAPPSYAEATSITDATSGSGTSETISTGVQAPDITRRNDLALAETTDNSLISSSEPTRQSWFGKSIAMPFRSQGRVADMTPEQQRAQVKKFQKSADRMMFFFWLPCLMFFIAMSIGKAFLDKLSGIVS